MYAWYKRNFVNGLLTLEFEDNCSLAGCNSGIIAQELGGILSPTDSSYMGWIIPIAEKYNKQDYSFIIDIKPKGEEVFLCELDKVYGYSYIGWSPIMLRLKVLYNDTTSEEVDKNKFLFEEKEIIYTMLYVQGSIRDGKLIGNWNPPFGTITATLFWPEAMTFFYNQVKLTDPNFLNQEIKLIHSLSK